MVLTDYLVAPVLNWTGLGCDNYEAHHGIPEAVTATDIGLSPSEDTSSTVSPSSNDCSAIEGATSSTSDLESSPPVSDIQPYNYKEPLCQQNVETG